MYVFGWYSSSLLWQDAIIFFFQFTFGHFNAKITQSEAVTNCPNFVSLMSVLYDFVINIYGVFTLYSYCYAFCMNNHRGWLSCLLSHGDYTMLWVSTELTSWWRHQMETFSVLLALCAGNSPVTGEFPAQRPVTRSFDVFFDLRLNKQFSKQSWGWGFQTPSCPLWRHFDESEAVINFRNFVSLMSVFIWFRDEYMRCIYIIFLLLCLLHGLQSSEIAIMLWRLYNTVII